MSAFKTSFFILGCFLAVVFSAQIFAQNEQITPSLLKEELKLIHNNYYELSEEEKMLKENFESLVKIIEKMKLSLQKIQKTNPKKDLAAGLENLDSKLNALKESMNKNDFSKVKSNLKEVYSTCMQCHAKHRDPISQ